MKLTRRVAFSSNALASKRRPQFRLVRINWDAMTALSTAVSAVISLVVLCVAIRALRYTASQIDDYRKESQAQNLIQKVQEFKNPMYRAVRKGLAEKRLDRSRAALRKLDVDAVPVEMSDELTFCNDLGILTRHGALSAYDVWGEFSYWLLPLYADAQPVIKADQNDAPASWSNCDSLVREVRKIDAQEDAGKQLNQREKDITDFYVSELEETGSRSGARAKH